MANELPITIEDLKILFPNVSDPAGTIFIDTADAIIQARGIPTAYNARVAYLIELYLAAHFASLSSNGGGGATIISTKVGNSEDRYSNPTQALSGIANTRFGLDAIALDTQGLLTDLTSKALKAQFKVYGRESDIDSKLIGQRVDY